MIIAYRPAHIADMPVQYRPTCAAPARANGLPAHWQIKYPSRNQHRLGHALLALTLAGAANVSLAQTTTQAPAKAAAAPAPDPVPVVTIVGKTPGGLARPYAGGQVARGGKLGILGNADVMETPFNTVNYTAETLQNQQSRTLADVVINDPSVRVLTAAGGFGDDFLIRGFAVPSGDVGLNGLFGLTSSSRLATDFVERVEVLKGPGALLNGISPSGSVGGGINIITKRAADAPLTRLDTSYRSDGQFGVNLDVGRRFGENKEWGVRFNGSRRSGEANLDGQDQKMTVGALGVDYDSGHVRWSFDAFSQDERVDNVRPQIAFLAGSAIPAPPSNDVNFAPGTDLQLRDTTVATRLEVDLNDHITAYGAIGKRRGRADQLFAAARSGTATGDFTLNSGYYDSTTETTSFDAGLRTRLDTGLVRHNIVVSTSRLEQEAGSFASPSFNRPSNIYNPVPVPTPMTPRLNPTRTSTTTLSSVALADTMSMLDQRLLLTLGARQQNVAVQGSSGLNQSQDKSALTPMAGVVFMLSDRLSLYANQIEGLTAGPTAPATAVNAGEVFAPYKSTQQEVGVKFDSGSLISTLSVFQITRPNSMLDPATLQFSVDGEQRNRGIELNTFGELARSVRVMAGATYIDSTLTRTQGGVNQGNAPAGVPSHTLNLGGEWDIDAVHGLTATGRAIHTASVYSNANNQHQFPGWTRYDAGLRYVTSIANKPLTIRASIENLLDKDFWVLSGSFASVAAPRTFVLSASMDF